MTAQLRYGDDVTIQLDLVNGSLLADCGQPSGEPLEPAAAMAQAISEPVEFPPLAQAIAPGDQVVLALGRSVPQAAELLAPLVDTICQQGVDPAYITILQTREDVDAGCVPPASRLAPAYRSAVQTVVHNPQERSELAYLASTEDGQPIYLNRILSDADLVIPIGRATARRSGDGFAAAESLYPTFSDVATRERFAKLTRSTAQRAARLAARQQVREVNWLLGVLFDIQVVPAGGGGVLAVIAGSPESVRSLARKRCEQAWNFSVPRRASLVVAAIEGDASEQTWDCVGRAVAAAARAVADDGTIAICSKLGTPPGVAVKQIGDSDDRHRALRRIRKQQPTDALPAAQLARAMQRARVYLLSDLDDEVVEELGMAPVSTADDISRLVARHPSCILLGNAQHAIATPLTDE